MSAFQLQWIPAPLLRSKGPAKPCEKGLQARQAEGQSHGQQCSLEELDPCFFFNLCINNLHNFFIVVYVTVHR
jgi:hypothetical protein